jgi:diaminohydroxyphosphoribosylaminopyrimidine deaminase/5-amino-6-(5-phosphoribosylamino)uracil reductase
MHNKFLLQALELANIRRGFCAPNPSVGAVVVKENKVLATGYHYAAGQAHAEVSALSQLGDQAKGATIYVTLEPCCHWGKTPPCTDLLIERGIAQVFYGFADPNPLVAGAGVERLHRAGIRCELLPLPEIAAFYQSYCFWLQHKLPFVTAKLAMTLDGKIAGPQGVPMKITSAEADQFTHQCRLKADALLTTVNTIYHDNPQLNVRLDNTIIAKPLYIIDRDLQLQSQAKVFTTAQELIVFHAQRLSAERKVASDAKPIRYVAIKETTQGLDLAEILAVIGKEGRHDLWVEAGGGLVQNLILENFIQRAYFITAPKWLGNEAKPAFSQAIDITAKAAAIGWQSLGEDGLCVVEFVNSP